MKNGDRNHNAAVRLTEITNNLATIFILFSARSFRSVPPSTKSISWCLNGTIIDKLTNPAREMKWNIRATVVSRGLTHVDRTISESDVSINMAN